MKGDRAASSSLPAGTATLLFGGEIDRLWREGQTLDDDGAYALASAAEEPARQRK